jgi:hypothetical protein
MDPKKIVFAFLIAASLICSVHPAESRTNVNINVGIGVAPPAFVFPAPPEVVVIPGTYVYFVPGIDVDILFYHGYWYRPYEGRWYRARSYAGPWGYIGPGRVPHVLLELPHDYRHIGPGYERIPYGHLRKSWRQWERERHWDRGERHERGRGHEGREHGRY